MTKQNINLGIIGMGEHIRRAHVPGLLNIEGVRFVRWFDPGFDPAAATATMTAEEAAVVAHLGVKSTFEEIINDEHIHGVLIGSPDRFHPDQFLAAITAGKHVFVEKPLATDTPGFNKIVEGLKIAREKGLVVSSCHPRRFDPPMLALKKFLDNDQWVLQNLGKITYFDFRFLYHQATDAWKQDRSLMLDHFGHEIDLIRYLFNKTSQSVVVSAKKLRDGYAAYTVEGKIDDIDFLFDGMRILDEKKYQEYLEIRGTVGTISLYLNAGIAIQNSEGMQKVVNFPAKDYTDMFKIVNENFIAAIRKEDKPYLDYYDFAVNNYSGIALLEKGSFRSESDVPEC